MHDEMAISAYIFERVEMNPCKIHAEKFRELEASWLSK